MKKSLNCILCFYFFFLLCISIQFSGCGLVDSFLAKTVPPETGKIALRGLNHSVEVRRDEFGIPVIIAADSHDMAMACGFVMAQDRLAQMVGYSLLAQGRLAEMAGPAAFKIDLFMRTIDLVTPARESYEKLPAELKDLLSAFAKGVNAYLDLYADRFPLDFMVSGYTPERWKPIDSIYVYYILNFGLSFNLREEIAYINIAQTVGPEKAAWLFPIYYDEPLSMKKAKTLASAGLGQSGKGFAQSIKILGLLDELIGGGIPASNNWAVSPARTKNKATIVANDTHLPLMHPPVWMIIQVITPGFHVAGVAIPGVPGIAAGFNGHIAWGMTMVMGDTQDIFLEKLKVKDQQLYYLYRGEWLKAETRKETFRISGHEPVTRTIFSTRHGPLLNFALDDNPRHPMLPQKVDCAFGLALSSVHSVCDTSSFLGMYRLYQAKDMKQARDAISMVSLMALNFVYGDRENIAWQVSGRYPIRKNGRGHLPSLGWTGEYDWMGYIEGADLPYEMNPARGFVNTSNHRTIQPGMGPLLSSSWYSPERAQRVYEVLSSSDNHRLEDSIALQADWVDTFVMKMQKALFMPPMELKIEESINNMKDPVRKQFARSAMGILAGFDGKMLPDSPDAALYAIFRHVLMQNIFADELGGTDSLAWKSLVSIGIYYSADQDHILGRDNSPFWDDIRTPVKETKADIVARSLADAIVFARNAMGRNPESWAWGKLHTYSWETATTQISPFLPFFQRIGAWLLGRYTDRGPFPAGGDINTVNVAGYLRGHDFKVWLIPAMRMIVDFSKDEPLYLVNSGGQSGNPASPHFDDGIPLYLSWKNRELPFSQQGIAKGYTRILHLEPYKDRPPL